MSKSLLGKLNFWLHPYHFHLFIRDHDSILDLESRIIEEKQYGIAKHYWRFIITEYTKLPLTERNDHHIAEYHYLLENSLAKIEGIKSYHQTIIENYRGPTFRELFYARMKTFAHLTIADIRILEVHGSIDDQVHTTREGGNSVTFTISVNGISENQLFCLKVDLYGFPVRKPEMCSKQLFNSKNDDLFENHILPHYKIFFSYLDPIITAFFRDAHFDVAYEGRRSSSRNRYFQNHEFLFYIMDLGVTSLKSFLKTDPVLECYDVLLMLRSILKGLVFLQSQNFIHCDVKPSNFVLTSPENLEEIYLIDLSDLTYFEVQQDRYGDKQLKTPYSRRLDCGAGGYGSPEKMDYNLCNCDYIDPGKVDIYSVGIMLKDDILPKVQEDYNDLLRFFAKWFIAEEIFRPSCQEAYEIVENQIARWPH